MDYSSEALGQVIRELREARTPKLSQEELGRQAGYRTGAGVSMSRVESGVTRPGPRRLQGIATALGLTAHELESRGAQRSRMLAPRPGRRPPSAGRGAPPGGRSAGANDREPTKDRMRRIQGEVDRRTTEAVTGGHAFNVAHDSARDDFFLELVRAARTISGLPAPAAPRAHSQRSVGPSDEATLRRQVAAYGLTATLASGAGAAAAAGETDAESAYSAVVAAAMLTPAPAAPAHPEAAHPAPGPLPAQSGAMARATRALLGGTTAGGRTGIAAGTLLLAGFVASAGSPLFAAGTLAWLARRSRRQNDQLRLELDQAEANLAATQQGFSAVMDILARATELLQYVAVHGSHAQRRWLAHLPDGPRRWSDLRPDQQHQYTTFVDVATCQVWVDTIDMTELLAAPPDQQARLIQVADDILTMARESVTLLV
jgi:transcriptional regulator with XRE-family HTH domain